MKLKLFVCLVMAGALVTANSSLAAPQFEPFLSVDINGYQNSDGTVPPSPTQAGFQAWDVEDSLFAPWNLSNNATGISQVFATSMGNVSVTMTGHTAGSRAARDRGATTGPLNDLRRDFVFTSRTHDGFGQHWIKLELSGLEPGKRYEFTGLGHDFFNGNGDPTLDNSSFQAWTDLARLGGLNGPGAWMDDNFGPNSVYQPAIGGVNNPIPTLARGPISGPTPADGEDYRYAATFRTVADAGGVVTVYTWSDPNGYSGTQTVTLLGGFEIGCVPEPTTFALFALGLVGVAGLRCRGR